MFMGNLKRDTRKILKFLFFINIWIFNYTLVSECVFKENIMPLMKIGEVWESMNSHTCLLFTHEFPTIAYKVGDIML